MDRRLSSIGEAEIYQTWWETNKTPCTKTLFLKMIKIRIIIDLVQIYLTQPLCFPPAPPSPKRKIGDKFRFLRNCLPTPSPPKPIFSLFSYLEQNVGLGEEGVGGQFSNNYLLFIYLLVSQKPKFIQILHKHCFQYLLGFQSSQEKLKTIFTRNFEG